MATPKVAAPKKQKTPGRSDLYKTLCGVGLDSFETKEELEAALALKNLLKPVVKPRKPRTPKTIGQ